MFWVLDYSVTGLYAQAYRVAGVGLCRLETSGGGHWLRVYNLWLIALGCGIHVVDACDIVEALYVLGLRGSSPGTGVLVCIPVSHFSSRQYGLCVPSVSFCSEVGRLRNLTEVASVIAKGSSTRFRPSDELTREWMMPVCVNPEAQTKTTSFRGMFVILSMFSDRLSPVFTSCWGSRNKQLDRAKHRVVDEPADNFPPSPHIFRDYIPKNP